MRAIVPAVAASFVVAAVALAAEPAEHGHMGMTGAAKAEAASAHTQKTCPVSGKPIDKNASVDYEGQKIYFCCDNCPAKFKSDPIKYLSAVYRQIYPQRVQVNCPVMGEAIDGKTFIDFKGERVGFCCDSCPPKFKASPAKYAAKLEAAYADEVHGPVTGKAINPQVSIEYQGKTVYFHSADALKEFKAQPAKYAERLLPQVGVLARGATAGDDIVLCAVAAPDKAAHVRKDVQTAVFGGKTYFLANADDAKTFKADPAKYAKKTAEEMKSHQDESNHWSTCSMHPEVLQEGPGKCPICDMKLVPVGGHEPHRKATAEPAKNAGHPSAAGSDHAKVVYTCPMHPNVLSDKAGPCPQCGMKLVLKK